MSESDEPVTRHAFLTFAAVFEGILLFGAFVVGWLVGINPVKHLVLTWTGFALGLLGTVPMLLLFFVGDRVPLESFKRIRRFLVEMLGPYLDQCRWFDLLLLAAVVGLCEEILFRGLLQPWIGRLGYAAGIIGSNILFGLAHFVTPLYAVWAAVVGMYLAYLFEAGESPNLLAPLTAHAMYDFIGFVIVQRAFRKTVSVQD